MSERALHPPEEVYGLYAIPNGSPELNEGQDEALMAVAEGAEAAAAVVTEELRPAAAGYGDS
jgi:hypothetical protein